MKTATTENNEQRSALKSTAVMALLGFQDRKSFWEFVYREGLPHTRLSARNIVFWPGQLDAWLARRSTGAVSP